MDRLPRDFGITEEQFLSVIATAAGVPIVRCEIARWLQKQSPNGIRGRYAMPVIYLWQSTPMASAICEIDWHCSKKN